MSETGFAEAAAGWFGAGEAGADMAARQARRRRGKRAYLCGQAAEDSVARHYARQGRAIAARRWRGRGGEIDLIARDGSAVIFIEVKQARDFAAAAERLSERQMARIAGAAAEFLGGEPDGLNTEARFDVALVDGQGRVDILENAFWEPACAA